MHCLDQEIGHLTTLSETQVEEKKNKEQEMKLAKNQISWNKMLPRQ